ncbi:(4Fe-4S)-binding protein [Streptomyces sp. NPDC007818]|uniref:(4Fe-4S)-binding protein n=1 Tax=Streptomyces sp. NPDC007818 TaxID=3364780 RepID=UPI0036A51BDC
MTEVPAEAGAEAPAESPIAEKPRLKEYDGEGITVTFEPRRCLHAAECVHGLPEVYDLSRRPCALPDAAASEPAVPRPLRVLRGAGRRRARAAVAFLRKRR